MSLLHDPSFSDSIHIVDSSDPQLVTLFQTLKGAGLNTLLINPDATLAETVSMLEARAPKTGFDAIHIYGHGTPGCQDLGQDEITGASIDEQAISWKRLAELGAPGADLLLYGCNVAAGEVGQALVQKLAGITGLDVAASDDITGNRDWNLEVHQGAIEHGADPSLQGWTGSLEPESEAWMNVLDKRKEQKLKDAIAGQRGEAIRKATFVGYHLTNQSGSDNTVVRALQDFWDRVAARTNGKLNMTVLESDANMPGSDNEALLALSNGRVEAVTAAAPIYSGIIPEVANIMGLLFAINDSTEGRALANSPIFKKELLAAGKPYGWRFLTNATLNQGMRDVTTIPGHELASASDLNGFVLRIPPAKAVGKQLKSLGVTPIEAPVSQLQNILISGEAYGQENPASFIETFDLKGICNQISLTNHLWTGFLTAINSDTWASWPSAWRKIVLSEQKQMQQQQWASQDAYNQSIIDNALPDYGMTVVTPDLSGVTTNAEFIKTRNQVIRSLQPDLRPLAKSIVNGYYTGS